MLILIGSSGMLAAQAPTAPQAPAAPQEAITTLKLQTRIVGVSAMVRDKKGHPISNLTKQDFTLKEDGKPQTIRYFSQGSELPLTLALLVDTSGSQRGYIEDETKASKVFFQAMLTRPEDRAVLVQFDSDVRRLQAMTNSVEKLQAGLSLLDQPHEPGLNSRGGTLLYDAIDLTTRALLVKEEGRRAMVLLTDGGDNGSRLSIAQAIATAQRDDIIVYSIFYGEDRARDRGMPVLKAISDYTGGRVFTVTHKTSLADIYAQIAEDMRLQYQIGYTPPESSPGTYHIIDLQPVDKHMTIEARKGYYTMRPKPSVESTPPTPASN
jgi:Ca-activated chloride channel family protein